MCRNTDDNKSLFTTEEPLYYGLLHDELKAIINWEHEWKMVLNLGPKKLAADIYFLQKKIKSKANGLPQ